MTETVCLAFIVQPRLNSLSMVHSIKYIKKLNLITTPKPIFRFPHLNHVTFSANNKTEHIVTISERELRVYKASSIFYALFSRSYASDVEQQAKIRREKTIFKIYGTLYNYKENSAEYDPILRTGNLFSKYFQLFDEQADKIWQEKNCEYILSVSKAIKKENNKLEDYHDIIRFAMARQTVSLEGNDLSLGDSKTVYNNSKKYYEDFKDESMFDYIPDPRLLLNTKDSKKLQLAIELNNSIIAHEYAYRRLKNDNFVITIEFCNRIHSLLMHGVKYDKEEKIGTFRKGLAHAYGSLGIETYYSHPVEILNLMNQLLTYIHENQNNTSLHPVIFASKVYAIFLQIHPFANGNGRTGRTIQAFLQAKAGYPPILLQRLNRKQYLQSLQQYFMKNVDPFHRLIFDSLHKYVVANNGFESPEWLRLA